MAFSFPFPLPQASKFFLSLLSISSILDTSLILTSSVLSLPHQEEPSWITCGASVGAPDQPPDVVFALFVLPPYQPHSGRPPRLDNVTQFCPPLCPAILHRRHQSIFSFEIFPSLSKFVLFLAPRGSVLVALVSRSGDNSQNDQDF